MEAAGRRRATGGCRGGSGAGDFSTKTRDDVVAVTEEEDLSLEEVKTVT